jgi:hypothetical protein
MVTVCTEVPETALEPEAEFDVSRIGLDTPPPSEEGDRRVRGESDDSGKESQVDDEDSDDDKTEDDQ